MKVTFLQNDHTTLGHYSFLYYRFKYIYSLVSLLISLRFAPKEYNHLLRYNTKFYQWFRLYQPY